MKQDPEWPFEPSISSTIPAVITLSLHSTGLDQWSLDLHEFLGPAPCLRPVRARPSSGGRLTGFLRRPLSSSASRFFCSSSRSCRHCSNSAWARTAHQEASAPANKRNAQNN
jgi:hypothetical protein